MEDDDSSIQLVYDDNANSPRIKVEPSEAQEEEEEERECILIENGEENNENDKDPMDLLELLQKRSPESDLESKKSDTNGESDLVDGKLLRLKEKHEWWFEETDGYLCWCLYCNVNLRNSCANIRSKHENSHSHKERSLHYVKFVEKLAKDATDDIYYISNANFDGNLNDVKEQRQSLDDDFMNFLWDKWEEEHDWLVRTDERNIGYCKYCHTKINVAISNVRKIHEESSRHNEFKKKAPKRRATICGAENIIADTDSNESQVPAEGPDSNRYFEKSKNSSDLCRCKLCDITMFQKSFVRHTGSNLHRQNLNAVDSPGVTDKLEKPDWLAIQKEHEWLIEDPSNSMEAFCKYCQKRLLYGTSAVKRLIHEHSLIHRSAVQAFLQSSDGGHPDNVNSGAKEHENCEINTESEQITNATGQESEGENSNTTENILIRSRKRRRTENKIKKIYPWAKKYKKDSRFYICQYCKVLLTKENFGGKKHENTIRHQQAKNAFFEKLSAKIIKDEENVPWEPARLNENFHPWLVKFKNGFDYVFCKYCNVRFSKSTSRAQHSRSARHIEAEKAYLEKERNTCESDKTILQKEDGNKNIQTPETSKDNSKERKSPSATQAELKKMKAQIMEWQKQFTWLRYEKNLQHNYGYCIYCKKSVYMPKFGYATKHQKTASHKSARNKIRSLHSAARKAEMQITNGPDGSATETASNISDEPETKRLRASSLKTAIETAKRLTAAHLEMFRFMENNGKSSINIVPKMKTIESQTSNTSIPPTPSPSIDSNVILPIGRDPFDLFFNSMSESLKRLPADLASEGKLKVMQIIFELEIRAQQRHNQSDVMNTSSLNTSLNGSVLNTTNENTINELLGIHSDIASVTESLIVPQLTPQPQQQQQQQQQNHHQQQNNQFQQNPNKQQIQSHLQKRKQNLVPKSTQQNSILQQHLLQPSQATPQKNFSNLQHGRNFSSSPSNRSTLNMGINQVQRDTAQPQHSQSTPRKPITNMGINNIPHRMSNNSSMSYTAKQSPPAHQSSSSTSSSLSTSTSNRFSNTNSLYQNNSRNSNGHSIPNKVPMIRPVPLSSLTVQKYSDDEIPIHHIQLNSSTQSKIIQLDSKISRR